MHFFKLKTVVVQAGPDKQEISYKGLIELCVSKVSAEGMSVAEMRKRIRILDSIDVVDDKDRIGLEDGDWDLLKQCINSMSWAIVSKEIIDFVDFIIAGGESE